MSDLISRQAAIDALDSIGSLDTDADRKYARGIFNALPSVEPTTGKWIPLGKRHGWVCSRCRKEDVYAFSMDDSFEYVLQDYFCPNCGARMKGWGE